MSGAGAHTQLLERLVDKPIDPHVAEQLDRFVDLLLGPGVQRGLLGPREADRLWERHLLNCAAVAPLLPESTTVADVGSGAGLPGVVLAIVRPDVAVTLVEPLLRRADFLAEVLAAVSLPNASVVRTRAEDLRGSRFDVVVARAVAPMDRLATWCWPLVKPGGTLLAIKGRRAEAELAEHRAVLMRLGAASIALTELGREVLDEPTTVVTMRKR